MPIVRLRFHAGVLAGILLVLATIVLINKTPMADWLVAPLIVPDANETTDAIVVLGAGVLDNCIVNNNGMRRVLLGVRLWRERRAPVLLFTGGAQDSCPVATAMALLARELGVPDEQVRVESRSRTTRENAESCALVLRGLGLRRVTLVTDQLHMLRAAGAFASFGIAVKPASVPVDEGHGDHVSMLGAGLREYVALAYYWMRGWLDPAPALEASRAA